MEEGFDEDLKDKGLLIALENLSEKTQAVVHTIRVLKAAKAKREKRQQRNFKLKANGGVK
jgi:hypothetical protein